MYTSGSTGQPLGVLGTELGIINRCQFQQDNYYHNNDDSTLQLRDTDVIAFSTPITFVDSIVQFMAPLISGKGTILAVQPTLVMTDPGVFITMIEKYKITHLTAVPTVWSSLLPRANDDDDDVKLRYLRVAVSSGEPLTQQLKTALLTTLLPPPPSCTLYNIYGCTEAAADCTIYNCTTTDVQGCTRDNGDDSTPYVCVGRPIKGFDIHIIPYLEEDEGEEEEDNDGPMKVTSVEHQVLQPGQEGRIVIRETKPGILALGYLSLNATTTTPPPHLPYVQLKDRFITNNDNTERRMFITDDKGWLDKDGNLYIAGRAHDLEKYKIGGEKVNELHIEQVLMKHPDVCDAVVINATQDSQLVAFVELKKTTTATTTELEKLLLRHCQYHLSWSSCPVRFVTLKPGTRWPRSEAGKLQRSMVYQWWKEEEEEAGGGKLQDRSSSSSSSSSSSMKIVKESTVHQAIVKALDTNKARQLVKMEPNDNIFQVGGASSATTVKIAALLGGINPILVFKYPSVRSLTRALQQQEKEKKRTGNQSRHRHLYNNNDDCDNCSIKGKKQRQGDAALARTNGSLKLRWKVKLSQCIDAPCLFLPCNQTSYSSKVVACSHGGDASCHDIHSGTMLWNVHLPGRADLGMAAFTLPTDSSFDDKSRTIIAVAVQSPDMIVLLNADDGRTLLTQHLPHPPSAQPISTSTGYASKIWVPTHGGGGLLCLYNIQMMTNSNSIICDMKTYQLPAPCSAKLTVLPNSDETRDSLTIIAACLDGSLRALHLSPSSSTLQEQEDKQVEVLWKADAPLFAPPQLTLINQSSLTPEVVVLTATVNGRVTAIKSDLVGKRNESTIILWSTLLPPPASIFAAMQLWKAGNIAFIGTQGGFVYCLDLTGGNIKSSINLGSHDDSNTSSSSVTGIHLLPNMDNNKERCYCCCTCSHGTIYILKVNNYGQTLNVDDQYRLGGEVFSPPQIVHSTTASLLVGNGCRDDHLYILDYT